MEDPKILHCENCNDKYDLGAVTYISALKGAKCQICYSPVERYSYIYVSDIMKKLLKYKTALERIHLWGHTPKKNFPDDWPRKKGGKSFTPDDIIHEVLGKL